MIGYDFSAEFRAAVAAKIEQDRQLVEDPSQEPEGRCRKGSLTPAEENAQHQSTVERILAERQAQIVKDAEERSKWGQQ
jgi:hypothetical protein